MSNASTRFTAPDPALAIGTQHQGFTVTAIEPIPEISGIGYVMRHDASGARLMWLATSDTNRSFAIAFKTPPTDDTGVFHILEHSVLCGSDRFPVKEPFVELIKSSMQTFLNALTFSDKTMYPVSSTNVADLENLMDVYLDAVLHPAIYHKPRIFEQEGWHLECEGPDAPLTYNGVVFNEMKGALSNPTEVAFMHLQRDLFPDTAYGFESGGDPRAIPTLTYERFLDHHARHYSLTNSYTILYGDLDIERELAFVGERFDGATERTKEPPNALDYQKPVTSALRRVEMATSPENASVTLAYVCCTAADRDTVLAADILCDALGGSNEAPLKRAVLDAKLGDDFACAIRDDTLQPQIVFELAGAKEGVAEQFQRLVEDSCAQLAAEGIDRERLEASLAQAEFNLREADWGGTLSDGVALSMRALASWLYDDERPVDYLRYEDALAHLRAGLDEGLFERLLRETVCESTHCAAIELVPTEEGDAEAEAEELARLRATMSDEEVQRVIDEVAALRTEQERVDSEEDLACLPRLTVADIGEAPDETPARIVEAPLPCLYHELDTHHIVYTHHYFDLRRLAFEDLPYVSILVDLLGRMPTERLTAAKLDTLVERNLGHLLFATEVYGKDDDPHFAKPLLVVSASALSEKVDELATIPAEVWTSTLFDDLDQIRDILLQTRVSMEQRFMGAGHSMAARRIGSYWSCASIVQEALAGVDYYRFLKDLLGAWDERASELPERLAALSRRIFTADEVLVSVTGSPEDRDRYWKAAGDFGLPTVGTNARAHRLKTAEPRVRNEAFIVPTNVCFVVEGQPRSAHDAGDRGTWSVASRILSYDYLWNEVRVKGGAYGCGFRHTNDGAQQFWSYRDPAADPSVRRFEQAADWIGSWDPTDDDLTGYIVSVVAAHDAPLGPRQLARRQDSLYIAGRPDDWRATERAERLAVTPEKVHALAPAIADLAQHRAFCIFGGREQIEASELDLEVVELMG